MKQVLPQLVQQGRVIRPWLGVSGKVIGKEVQDLLKLPLVDGFLVETIEPGSPAAKAGLHEGELLIAIVGEEFLFGGDIIMAANGKALDDTEKFAQFVRTLKVGDTVHLTLYHDGTTRQVEFTLPERPILPGDAPPDGRRALVPLGHRLRYCNDNANQFPLPWGKGAEGSSSLIYRDFPLGPCGDRYSHGRLGTHEASWSRCCRIRRAFSSGVCVTVSSVISGFSGTSYGSSIPVKSLISPRRALAYMPFVSRSSHTASGVSTNTSTKWSGPTRLRTRCECR